MNRPPCDSLPVRKQDPLFSAWGLYGSDDQLYTLNLLTPDGVREAAKEIKIGIRIGLDSPLDYLPRLSHNRLPLKHTIIHKTPRAVHDDVIELNTQVNTIQMDWNVAKVVQVRVEF